MLSKFYPMTESSLADLLRKSEFITLDGPITDITVIKDQIQNMGDLPQFYEEDQVRKALSDSGIDYDELIKARRNIGNLIAVRRQVVNQNGTAYMKTVYIKKEDITDNKKSSRFLAQHELEQSLQVGQRVKATFKGSATGAIYQTDKIKVNAIGDKTITLEFTEPFETNNRSNYIYRQGATITIPKSSTSEWSKDTSIQRYVEPVAQPTTPTQPARVLVESIDQISVGDQVMVKQKAGEPDIEGEIKYIHPLGNFIDIKVGDKVLRRKLGRFSTMPAVPPSTGLTIEKITSLAQQGVIITTPGSRSVSREDRSRVVGQEQYQQYTRVDRFGQPNSRGRSSAMITRTRNIYYQRTDEEMAALQHAGSQQALDKFNENFAQYNFEQYAQETRAAITSAFPNMSQSDMNVHVAINSYGGFTLKVDNSKFTMRREFSVDSQTGEKGVYHAYFSMRGEAQGEGLGKQLFKALYRQYKNVQMKNITVSANISVGGYAWGRYGFTSTKEQARSVVNSFHQSVGRTRSGYTVTQEDSNRAQEVYNSFYRDNPDSNARFPMNLLCSIGPNNKAGKAILLGTSWRGKLDLSNTQQRVHFENYIGFTE